MSNPKTDPVYDEALTTAIDSLTAATGIPQGDFLAAIESVVARHDTASHADAVAEMRNVLATVNDSTGGGLP